MPSPTPNPDPAQLPQMAAAQLHEDFYFRDFLKQHTRLSSKEVDSMVFEIAGRVWKRIDCTTCGNCCRVVAPTLSEEEVAQLAGHLGMNHAEFEAKYLQRTESGDDNPYIMRDRPCPFFKDNRCSVYERRPMDCRAYPYLDKPNLTSRTLSMIGRLSECPAVFEVWQGLKRATRFRYKGR